MDSAFEKLLSETIDIELVDSNSNPLRCPHTSGWRSMPFALVISLSGGVVTLERSGHETVYASQGEALLLSAGVRHCISMTHHGEMDLQYAHVRATVLGCIDIFRLLDMPALSPPEVGPLLGEICRQITAARKEDGSNVLSRVLRTRWLTEKLIDTVLRDVPWNRSTLDGRQGVARIAPVLHHIDENLGQQLTCAELANVAELSPTRFHEIFKQATGLTPIEFVIQVRLRRAQDLLLRTNDPVANIGRRLGFPDPFHFSRQFRTRCGISPSLYRKRGSRWSNPLGP